MKNAAPTNHGDAINRLIVVQYRVEEWPFYQGLGQSTKFHSSNLCF